MAKGKSRKAEGGALGERLATLDEALGRSHAAVTGAFERIADSQKGLYDRIAELEKKPAEEGTGEPTAEQESAADPEAGKLQEDITRLLADDYSSRAEQPQHLQPRFQIAADLTPDDAYKIYVAAVEHRNNGRYSEALAMVAALKETGKFAKPDFILAELGALYTKMGDAASARTCLEEALAMPKCDADVKKAATHNIGRAFEIEGKPEEAKKYAVAEKSAAIAIV